MPGVNGALVYKDKDGKDWLVKFPGGSKGTSQAYSNSLFLVDLDVATSRIQNKAGLPVPSIQAKTVDGKTASVHKMYSRVQDAFPDNKPMLSGPNELSDEDLMEIQKNMILDWLLSNHDPHSGNFLKTDKGIIGIDKGQSFKYFGKDKLTPNFGSDLNPPLAPNVPVYSTLMKQHMAGQGEMFSFNDPELQKTITRIQNIPDDEYKNLLRGYAEKGAKVGLLNYPGKSYGEKPDVEKFLQAAVDRKNNLNKDFSNLQAELDKSQGKGPATDADTIANEYKNLWDHGEYDNESDMLGDVYSEIGDKPAGVVQDVVKQLKDYAASKPKKAPESLEELSPEGMGVTKSGLVKNVSDLKVGDLLTFQGPVGEPKGIQVTNITPSGVTYKNLKTGGVGAIKQQTLDNGKVTWGTTEPVPVPSGTSSQAASALSPGDEVTWSLVKKGMHVKYGNLNLVLDKPTGPSVWSTTHGPGTSMEGTTGPKLYKVYFNEGSVAFAGPPKEKAVGGENTKLTNEEEYYKPSLAIDKYNSGEWDQDKLEEYVKLSEYASLDDINLWKQQGYIGPTLHTVLKDAFNGAVGLPTSKTAPPGYKVVPHNPAPGTGGANGYAIQKPNGQLSQNKDGAVKTWPSTEDAMNSSTMAKYKAQSEQQAKAGMAGAQNFAMNAPSIPATGTPPAGMSISEGIQYEQLKAKIAAGEAYTPDDYLKLKSWVSIIQSGAKAAGAAQEETDWEDLGGFEPPTPSQQGIKKGKMPTPKWKKKGAAPPPLTKATGPNALEDGQKLYDMKKAGQFNDDDELWKAASKLSNAYKKKVQLQNPGKKLVSGEDYSSPNQIRNVSQRLEFDEVGDVIWETKAEKTAGEETQTAKQTKSTNALHAHKPVVKASAAHHIPTQMTTLFSSHIDASAPVGSYSNPHAFKLGDTQALQAYGYKYTDHNKGWPYEQKNAWYNFSGSGSGSVNTYFRVGEAGFSFGNITETKKRCKALVDAFKSDNVKPLEDWTTVVRGTSGGWEFGIGSDAVTFDQIKAKEGKVVRVKEPKSSSLRDRPPWGSIRITYKLPPGFRGLGIYGKSSHGSENEMILPPGMAYRILEVKKGGSGGYSSFSTEVLVEVVDVKLPEIEI
jgi:hypothetical protein